MSTTSSTRKTVLLALGTLATITGIGLGIGGGALVWAHTSHRDPAGFYSTSAERLDTPSFAMKSGAIDFGVNARDLRWIPGGATAVRLQATSSGTAPVFVGIARTAEVERYLGGTAHAEITDLELDPFRADMRTSTGSARPAPPVGQSFWAMSANGSGTQTVTWPVQSGDWTVVVMNADASPGVAVDMAVGAKTGALLPIGVGMSAVGIALFVGGTAMVIAGSAARGRGPQGNVPAGPRPSSRVPANTGSTVAG